MNPKTSPPAQSHNQPQQSRGAATAPIHKKIKDKRLKQIINYLRLNHALDTAFLISKQTHTHITNHYLPKTLTHQTRSFTYTLCIFTNKSPQRMPAPAQITDELYNHTQKQAKVHIIPFTTKAAIHHYHMGHTFITNICNHTPCLYTNNPFWETDHKSKPSSNKETRNNIQNEWNTRFKRASYLHDLTVYNDMNQDPVAYFEVLQKVIEQTCLGLIYVFWQYKPSYTGLSYLMHLCAVFTDLPSTIFNTNTIENHQILHHLTQANHNLKYKTRHNITLKQIDKAWRKCHSFLNKADQLVSETLNNNYRCL